MLAGQLTSQDRVAMVVYASQEGLVLPATEGDRQAEIVDALERLEAGGSTNGGAGIRLAYSVAKEQLIHGGVNRVILCTDGDFNVGVTSTGDLVRMAETEAKAGVFLTVLGFGMGNHNDAMLEELSNKANGAYAFIDNAAEARKVFIDQIDATLVTIAKDVKIQVEFNPGQVAAYRLIGYENRLLQAEDFNDDRKDAGEVGAGHTVTALYELVMAGSHEESAAPRVDPLRYQQPPQASLPAGSEELLTLKVRYKDPDADRSRLLTVPLPRGDRGFAEASTDFRFAASVAAFGMVLRQTKEADVNLDAVLEMATAAQGSDRRGYRGEFLQMVQAARQLNDRDRTSSVIGTPRRVVIGAPRVVPNPQQVVVTYPRASVESPVVSSLALGFVAWLALNAVAALFLLCVIGVVYLRLSAKRVRY
jgi:Ca-activated chloride channel family protein